MADRLPGTAGGNRVVVSPLRGRWQRAVLFSLPILAAGWFWHSLVRNYFSEDDFTDLFLICNIPLGKYLLTPHAGHVYLVRNAVYYTAARLFGTNPEGYFTVVWCTHLVNVALLFWTAELFTGSAWIACFAALLFGTCPVLDGSLGWFAVFGHVLAATALLLVLADAGRLAACGAPLNRARRWAWAGITLASVTLFGVSIGIAVALPLTLAVLLPRGIRRGARLPLWPLIVIVPAAYAGSMWLYGQFVQPVSLASAEVITAHVAQKPGELVTYGIGLVAYGIDRLLLGPVPLAPFPALAGSAVAGAAAILALWILWYGPPTARRLLCAAALLTGACYGSIAGGRSFFVSVFGYAQAVAQLRYHYVGIVTLALGVAAGALTLATALPALAARRVSLLAAFLAAWLTGVWVFQPRIDHHDQARTETMFLLAWMRSLAHQVPPGEDVYFVNRAFAGVSPLFFTRREFPGWAGVFSIYFPDPHIDGRRALFIEPDASVRAAHRNARRLIGALVAPEDVPPQPQPLTPIDPICPLPSK